MSAAILSNSPWRYQRHGLHNPGMRQFLMLLPVVVPVLFWAGYHYHKDRDLPEPVGKLLLAFGFGMLAVGVSMAMYSRV